jgi:hypothetical protein
LPRARHRRRSTSRRRNFRPIGQAGADGGARTRRGAGPDAHGAAR